MHVSQSTTHPPTYNKRGCTMPNLSIPAVHPVKSPNQTGKEQHVAAHGCETCNFMHAPVRLIKMCLIPSIRPSP